MGEKIQAGVERVIASPEGHVFPVFPQGWLPHRFRGVFFVFALWEMVNRGVFRKAEVAMLAREKQRERLLREKWTEREREGDLLVLATLCARTCSKVFFFFCVSLAYCIFCTLCFRFSLPIDLICIGAKGVCSGTCEMVKRTGVVCGKRSNHSQRRVTKRRLRSLSFKVISSCISHFSRR